MNLPQFAGSLVAVVTPMRADGAVDYDAWSRLLEFQAQAGTSGIVVGGSTGESATLEEPELHELLQRAARQLRGRVQLIAGAGGSSTAQVVERLRRLSALPLSGVLVVTPAYNRPTQEGLFQHFSAVAAAAAAPVILYNVPGRTAVDLLPATVARLANLPGIAAMKEAAGSEARIRELLAIAPKGFEVLSGDDPSCRAATLAGASGVISVTANVAPTGMARMIDAARRGDAAGAAALDAPLAALHTAQSAESNPIAIKWALAEMGLIQRGIRLPLTWLAESQHAKVRAALQGAIAGEHLGTARAG